MYSGGTYTDPNNNSGAVTFTGSSCPGTDPSCPFDCCRKWNGAIPPCADHRTVGLQTGDRTYNAFRYIAAPSPPPQLPPPPPSQPQPRPSRASARLARPRNQLQARQPRQPRMSAPVAPTPFPFPGPVQRMTPPVQMPPWHQLPAHTRPPTPMTPEVYRAFQAGFIVGQSQSSQPQPQPQSVVQNNDMHAFAGQPVSRMPCPPLPPSTQGIQRHSHPYSYPYGHPHPATPTPPPWANGYGSVGPMYPPQFSSPYARHTRTPANGSFCECGCPAWPGYTNQAQMHTQPPQHWIPRSPSPSPTSSRCSNRCDRIHPSGTPSPLRAPPCGQYGQEFGNVGPAHQQRIPVRVIMPVVPTPAPTPSMRVPPMPPPPPQRVAVAPHYQLEADYEDEMRSVPTEADISQIQLPPTPQLPTPENPLQQLSHMTAVHMEDARSRFQVPGAKRGRRQREVDGQDQLIRNYCPPPPPPPGFEDPPGSERQQNPGTSVQLQIQNPPRRQRETLAELHDRIRLTKHQLRQQLPRMSDGAMRPKPHTPSPPASPPPTPASLVIDEGSPGNSESSQNNGGSGTEQPIKRVRGRPRKSVTPVGVAAKVAEGLCPAAVSPPDELVMADTDTRACVEVIMEELASRITPNPVPQPGNQSTSLDFLTNTTPSPPPSAPPSTPPPTQPPTSFLSSSLRSPPRPPKTKRAKLTSRFEINCSICNKLCKSNKSLQKHVKLVHFQPEIRHRGITWFPPRPPPPFVGDLQQLRHASVRNARGPGLTPPPLFVGPAGGAAAARPRPSPSHTPQFPVIRPQFLRQTTPTPTPIPLQQAEPLPSSSAAALSQMPPFKRMRMEGYQPQPRPFCRQPSCLTCSPGTATASAVPPLPQRPQIRERIPTSRPIRPPETAETSLLQPPVAIETNEPTHTPEPLLPIPSPPTCPLYEVISPCSSPSSPSALGPTAPTTELMGMLTETSAAVLEALIIRPRTAGPTLPHRPSPPSPPLPPPRPPPPVTPLDLRKPEPEVFSISDSEDDESENQSSSNDDQATSPAKTTKVQRSPDLRTPSQAGSPSPSSCSSSGGSCSSSSSQSQGPEFPNLPRMSPSANSHQGPPTPDTSTQSPPEAEDSDSADSSPASPSPDEHEDESDGDGDGDGRHISYASSLCASPPPRTPTPKSPAFVSISRAASGSPEPEMPPTPPSSMSSPARSPESSTSNPESPPESPQSPSNLLQRKLSNPVMVQQPIVVNLVPCPFCPFLCIDEGHKLAHCEEMHSENELVFCGSCFNIFLGKAMLKEHEANGCRIQD